jgi:DNA-binding FadR family transcriptional regulator
VREALFRLRNEGFLGVGSKLGWHVLPIDFGRLEQLYDLRVVLELASIARLCARADAPPGLEALKAVWLVSPGERWTTRAASAPTTSSSTPRSSAPPATTRWRAFTGT